MKIMQRKIVIFIAQSDRDLCHAIDDELALL